MNSPSGVKTRPTTSPLCCLQLVVFYYFHTAPRKKGSEAHWLICRESINSCSEKAGAFFRYILVFSQQSGTGYVKDSDKTRAEATGEDWIARMESHTARAVHRHKVVQLFTGDNRMQHYC